MANERSELILRVDDLTHKVLRCESEVAVGETFDLVFFGGRLWDGDSAKVFLYDDKERLLWSASGVVEARSDGAFVIVGCVIDTEQAAAYANRGDKRGRRVYGELIRVDVEGERTDYGDFSFLLHKGVSAEGTPLVKFLDDLSAHEVDGEAHEDIRQEIAQVETSILASVSQDLEAHSVIEETARNEAIHRAVIDLRSELEGGADGIGAGAVAEATRQAALAGEIAVGVADSARAAAVSAETAAQAAKDGASYLNLIINASKSALASKDQAQAFATSSSEAKDAAEASIASVNSDRLAVEAARDKVIEARNDVISAQVAVGGLLSSARESEAAARESASTASRAANDAESAKSDAEVSRDRAVVARDEAEAFASGAARSEEASEASAVRSEKAAAQSAQETAESVTALLQGKVDAAEAAKAGAEAAKTAAETAQGKAEDAQAAAASSATAAATSADAAANSAAEAASQVTDTLKRLTFAGGRFYSKYFNANTASITFDTSKAPGDHALMAWNDRYLVLSTSLKGGWFTMLGKDLSFIASAPYHYNYYIYTHALFYQVGFNGERVAIFYRFNEYNAEKGICNYAEVLDANTGDVLIEKTFTAEEMAFIKAAPCWGIQFTCILKNGDMIHRGTIFSGEDLSIKGYVATEAGFAYRKDSYSTYCCYLTANADNNYSGADPIIVQSNDNYSFWVDDRWTLDANGNPIVTLRNFLIDGIYDENKVETRRDVGVLFSTVSSGWGGINHFAMVRNGITNKLASYQVAIDETQDNRIVFRKRADVADSSLSLNQFVPTNYFTGGLVYNGHPFYLQRGELVYYMNRLGSISASPYIVFCGNKRLTRTAGAYDLPSVAFLSGGAAPQRLIPCDRHANDGTSFIYPVENA